MLKRIAAFMVVLTMVFAFQSTALAAAIHADDTMVPQQTEVITLDANPQLASINQDIQLLNATGFGGMKVEPWFWVLSIVIPGLGQFLMGDMIRGLLFFFGPTLVAVVSGVVLPILATTLATTGGAALVGILAIVGPVLGLVMLGIYIWNVVDAYFMNQGMTGPMKLGELTPEQMAAEVQKIAEFAQKNQLVAYNGGAGLQHQLASF